MQRTATPFAGAAMAMTLITAGCAPASDSTTKPTTSPAASANSPDQLRALLPAPTGTQRTDGPNTIADNGIHLFYAVGGAPADVMNAYKSALQKGGWTVTTIVSSSGGPGGGGGATYTGTHGDNYGVFDGGGRDGTTYLNICTWPTKPTEPNCSRG